MQFRSRRPRTARHFLALAIVVATLLLGLWPVVALFNSTELFLGMPLLMTWSIVVIGLTTGAMLLVNALGVHGTDEVPAVHAGGDTQGAEAS